jgi:hypothetical protein
VFEKSRVIIGPLRIEENGVDWGEVWHWVRGFLPNLSREQAGQVPERFGPLPHVLSQKATVSRQKFPVQWVANHPM